MQTNIHKDILIHRHRSAGFERGSKATSFKIRNIHVKIGKMLLSAHQRSDKLHPHYWQGSYCPGEGCACFRLLCTLQGALHALKGKSCWVSAWGSESADGATNSGCWRSEWWVLGRGRKIWNKEINSRWKLFMKVKSLFPFQQYSLGT